MFADVIRTLINPTETDTAGQHIDIFSMECLKAFWQLLDMGRSVRTCSLIDFAFQLTPKP